MGEALDNLTNNRHRIFCMEYVAGGCQDPGDAYVRAGYTPKNPLASAQSLMQRDDIKAAVAELLGHVETESIASAERTIQELADVGYANLADVAEWGTKQALDDEGKPIGNLMVDFVHLKDSAAMPRHISGAVAGVKMGKFGIEIKMHPKTKALDVLAKAQGLYSDAPIVGLGVEDVLDRIEKRRKAAEAGGDKEAHAGHQGQGGQDG